MKKVDIRLLRRGDMVKFGSEEWRPFYYLREITEKEYVFEECNIFFTNIKKVKRAENPRRKKFVFVEIV